MLITVVVPTVTGRERSLERCLSGYHNTAGDFDLEIIKFINLPTCGEGWVKGAAKAKGDYIHFTSDDLEPLPGWAETAVETADRGFQPSPIVLNQYGGTDFAGIWGAAPLEWIEVPMSVVPFMSRAMLEAVDLTEVGQLHYYSDNLVSDLLKDAGFPTVFRPGYAFTHHWEQEKRGAGMTQSERMDHDQRLYQASRTD